MVGLSLHQVFSDAFGIKFEAEDRQRWLKQRQLHRQQYHPLLTSWLKVDAGGNSKAVNWGKEINFFKLSAGLPYKPVDTYSEELLQKTQ